MAFVPVAESTTAEEFIQMPVPSYGRPWNLVDGQIIVTEARRAHERLQSAIHFALTLWSKAEPGRGSTGFPIDIGIDTNNVYAPDVMWYREGASPARDADPPYPIPDIAVEVRSPSTWRFDIGAKKSGYERRGLPELWLVDTVAEAILVFRRSTPEARSFDVALELTCEDTLTSPLLPGFSVSLTDLFPARG